MGSGSTKKSKEDREPRMDSIQNNNNSDEVSLNKDGETVVDFLQNFENLLQTCSGLFDDGIDAFKWATENSCNLFDQLTRSCLRNTAGGKRHLEREEREEIASKVVISDITKHFTDCLQYIRQNYPDALEKDEKSLKNEFQSLDEEEDSKEKLELTILFQKIICAIVGFFVNNVDVSKNFGGKCVENGTVGILLQYVESYQNICFEEDKTDVKFENLRENKRIQTVNRVLSFHHNISKDFCEHMVKNKAIETMAPYVNSTNPLLAMKSLLVLSHLISEEQNNMITSTDGPISILLQHLEGAAKSNSNRYNGFETSELLMGLSKILQNDQNKKKVGDQGGIEILSQIIYKITSSNSEDENNMKILEFVFNCIYLLSFHEDNKENIMNNGVIVHALHNCSSMNNKSILIDAHGTLWELKDKKTRVPMKHQYMRSKSMKSKKATLPKLRKKSRSHSELEWNENQQLPNARELSVNEPISGGSSETEEQEEEEEDEQQPEEEEDVVIKEQKLQHIMISYQWSHQPIMLKVRDKLQEEGFTVWIDLDEMKGSTLEAMANAVEDAYLILVTVSSNYKASANTRSEAEYAFQLKKPIIPLMMERDYKADGWLGFIVGSKLWIDFIDENNIESSSLNNLVAEIHRQGFKPDNENEVLKPQPSPQPSTKFSDREELRKKISQWTPDDVRKWITSNKLKVNGDVIVKHLDGYVLLHLFDLRKEAPDTFYKFLKKDLALDTLKNLFQFADCLAKLLDDT